MEDLLTTCAHVHAHTHTLHTHTHTHTRMHAHTEGFVFLFWFIVTTWQVFFSVAEFGNSCSLVHCYYSYRPKCQNNSDVLLL